MKKNDFNDACLVCKGINLEKLCHLYSPHFLNIFRHPVKICKDCGHMQLSPLFGEEEYKAINDSFFGGKYLINGKQNKDNTLKIEKMNQRLSKHITERALNVLDVGAGEAWALEYFTRKGHNYSAVEGVDSLANSIIQRGSQVIANSIFEDLKEYHNKFDLILFRHVLEHMLDPEAAIQSIAGLLKENGLLYLAVPNAANVSGDKGILTSYLRPVHISYFCKENLVRIVTQCGFVPEEIDAGKEIFILFRKTNTKISMGNSNQYLKQKSYFKMLIKKNFLIDLKNIVKIFLRYYMRKAPK